jgi:hypothetical protein
MRADTSISDDTTTVHVDNKVVRIFDFAEHFRSFRYSQDSDVKDIRNNESGSL